jgi:hypothetical protein
LRNELYELLHDEIRRAMVLERSTGSVPIKPLSAAREGEK